MQINNHNPYLQTTIEDIKKTLSFVFKQNSNIVFAYLFGSIAKNEISPLNDIDIAVYLSKVNQNTIFDTKLSLQADMCRALKRNDVDTVLLNTLTNTMLIADIVIHGVVLCDRNVRLREDYEVAVIHHAIDFKTQRQSIMGV